MTDRTFRVRVKELWRGRSPHRLRDLRRLLVRRQAARRKRQLNHCVDCGEPVKGIRCFMHSIQHRYRKKQLAV